MGECGPQVTFNGAWYPSTLQPAFPPFFLTHQAKRSNWRSMVSWSNQRLTTCPYLFTTGSNSSPAPDLHAGLPV